MKSSNLNVFLGVLLVVLCGCSLTSGKGLSRKVESDSACSEIDGVFDNSGDRRSSNGQIFQDGLLAEHVFSRNLPGAGGVDAVRVRSDVGANTIYVDLIGRVRRSLQLGVSCDGGWLWFAEVRSGTSLGGGVQEKQYEKKVFLREGEEGSLLARVLVETELESLSAISSQTSTDNFYRFRRR